MAHSAAYPHDGRGPGWHSAAVDDSWHPRIARLLANGYLFLPQGFTASGVLFRGMAAGLTAALAARRFWQFDSSEPMPQLEHDLDVIFCSEHPGDALAVAHPWRDGAVDTGLLIVRADSYARRQQEHAAAMLALADPGMVFKYPLLAEPLAWEDLEAILVPERTREHYRSIVAGELSVDDSTDTRLRQLAGGGLFDKLQVPANGSLQDRAGWNDAVARFLRQHDLRPAAVCQQPDYPLLHKTRKPHESARR